MKLLGIDGGGSKTTFLLMEDDREIVRVQSGPSNWLSVGREAAANAIRGGVASLKTRNIDSVCGGFAGAGRREGVEFYRGILTEVFPDSRIRVESDAFIAYVGAIGLQPGVLLIAGTGSIAIGRTREGTMTRSGGWGPHFGDEGSGFWIGREAVRSALRSLDRNEANDFASRLATKLGMATIRDVPMAWANGSIGVPDVSGLFPEIATLWPAEPAAGILRAASTHLKTLVETALHVLNLPDCPVAAAGSIATNALMRELIGIRFLPPKASPEYGAILLART